MDQPKAETSELTYVFLGLVLLFGGLWLLLSAPSWIAVHVFHQAPAVHECPAEVFGTNPTPTQEDCRDAERIDS